MNESCIAVQLIVSSYGPSITAPAAAPTQTNTSGTGNFTVVGTLSTESIQTIMSAYATICGSTQNGVNVTKIDDHNWKFDIQNAPLNMTISVTIRIKDTANYVHTVTRDVICT